MSTILEECNNISNECKKEIEKLIKFMVDWCFSKINNLDDKKISDYHSGILKLLNNQKIKEPKRTELYKEMENIISSFFELIKNPEVVEAIKTKKIKKNDFINKYTEQLTGKRKRKYRMKDLYNATTKDLVKKASTRMIRSHNRVGLTSTEHLYYDSERRMIQIISLGELTFQEWNNINNSIHVYKIRKQVGDNKFIEKIVYSDIIIANMENPKYRNAVTEELLSDNNLMLSECEGYIGDVIKLKSLDNKDVSGSERQNSNGYIYRIDDEYVLMYDSTRVTAAMDYYLKSNEGKNKNIAIDNSKEEK